VEAGVGFGAKERKVVDTDINECGVCARSSTDVVMVMGQSTKAG
jgi:hypothetical protein